MSDTAPWGAVGLLFTAVLHVARRANPTWLERAGDRRLDWLLGFTAASFVTATVAGLAS